jgi:hypothetical protein
VIRTLDPTAFNLIANDPCVRPWLGGTGPVDLAAVVSDPDNICLLTPNEDGGYILHKLRPGLYEAHSLALESARGKPMLTLMRDGFRWLFTATECCEIVTKVPDESPGAARWADLAGFRELYRREGCFDLNGQIVGVSFRSLDYQSWVLKDSRNRRDGEAFHAQLSALKPHLHDDDPVHDAWVGATLEGCRQGNIQKAISLYNWWAALAGYYQPTILSVAPPVLHQGDAVVTLINGELSFLKVFDAPEG